MVTDLTDPRKLNPHLASPQNAQKFEELAALSVPRPGVNESS